MVRLSACLKAVTALTVEMTHKQSDRLISTETGIFTKTSHNCDVLTQEFGDQKFSYMGLVLVSSITFTAGWAKSKKIRVGS